ncbi:hypothetical protein [Clostridium uliginosum]|uniref:GHKL domain-containing protein n=1 Tax=Clostridium uliginosum TaxID=119641 RepID=A0A1I1HV97_9CLOT|nr:hypothetical protein [Clostridium uliginosum]SFC27725.1 hypothetical protein SAMN05421842_10217 [Clostridium uliginosum]
MLVRIASVINMILQSTVILIITNSCIRQEYKKKNIELIGIVFILLLASEFLKKYIIDTMMVIFYIHIMCLIILGIFYKKDIVRATISYIIIYLLMGITHIIFMNVIIICFHKLESIQYINIIRLFTTYIIDYIVIYYIFKHRKRIIKIHNLFINDKLLISMIILMTLEVDYIIILYSKNLIISYPLVKNLIIIDFFAFFILITIYFGNMKREAEYILKLNQILDLKNNQLRKIKHDYGAQISYLYGLYLMKRDEKLGESLKNIMQTNNNIKSAVQINYNIQNKLISDILKPVINKGIHVIVEDKGDLALVKMPQAQLHTILSNIVENISKTNGFIIVKTYNTLDELVINIENNVTEVESNTENNTLDIHSKSKYYVSKNIKHLVDKHNGSFNIKNIGFSTEFKIVLPLVEKIV